MEKIACRGEFHHLQLDLVLTFIQDLARSDYDVILTSPEMCLQHPEFRALLLSGKFSKTISHLVVDEAHVIPDWGPDFREAYAAILELRAMMNLSIPILATSATMTPSVLSTIRSSLKIDPQNSFHLNLGNNRPNITELVVPMKQGVGFEPLRVILASLTRTSRLPRCIVFFETRDIAQKGAKWLQDNLPTAHKGLKNKIGYIHAGRSDVGRAEVMRRFAAGEIDALCGTECAGMGTDLPDVDLVVQFGLPKKKSTYDQRKGRAGRAKQNARGVLFVEASAFQFMRARAKKPRKGTSAAAAIDVDVDEDNRGVDVDEDMRGVDVDEDMRGVDDNDDEAAVVVEGEDVVGEGDGAVEVEGENLDDQEQEVVEVEQVKAKDGKLVPRKKVDPDLRTYLDEEHCRREVTNKFFDGPPLPLDNDVCCDLCIMRKLPVHERNLDGILAYLDRIAPLPSAPISSRSIAHLPDSPVRRASPPPTVAAAPSKASSKTKKTPSKAKKAPSTKKKKAPPRRVRRKQWRKDCRASLERWRRRTFLTLYINSRYGEIGVLSDPQLTELSANRSLCTVEDLEANTILKEWRHCQKHGEEVLKLLSDIDNEYDAANLREKEDKATKRKLEDEAAARERDEIKRQKKDDDERARTARAREYVELNQRSRQPTAPHLGSAPSYGAPSYGASSYGAPFYDAPSHGAHSYGASSYGASSYGAPSHGAASYGAPSNGAALYGASSHGAPSHGASSYGVSSYGAAPYGAAAYGAAPYAPPSYVPSSYGPRPYEWDLHSTANRASVLPTASAAWNELPVAFEASHGVARALPSEIYAGPSSNRLVSSSFLNAFRVL
jgi:superfamily II DNA/RNA helicase